MESQKTKVVLVTGASQGIGKMLCLELHKAGYKVVGVARSTIDAPFEYMTCDVSSEKDVASLSQKISPDIIICAAAICETDNNPYNPELVRKTMEINFFGTMNFVNTFKNTKHFIAISSLSAFKPNQRSISYSASKAAVAMAFRGLDMNSTSTRYSTIYLGPVNTPMWEGKKSWIVAEPEDIAKKIIRLMENPKPVTYMPFVSTTLSRLSLLIPDALYTRISKFLFK